jgi:hypothetical protein
MKKINFNEIIKSQEFNPELIPFHFRGIAISMLLGAILAMIIISLGLVG